MSSAVRKAVVVGGLGVVGRAVIEHIDALADWEAVGLSRRKPDFGTSSPFISVDLLDRTSSAAELSRIADATDIVYAAYQPRPTWAELVEPNVAMLRNAVEAIERSSPGLRHVTLIQGGKAYGSHLGPYRTPAREDDGRHMPPEFYYSQEDFLREQRGRRGLDLDGAAA